MINRPDEPAFVAHREGPDDGPRAAMRTVALVAMVVGSLGSVGLMLYVGQRAPPFLLVLFLGWVLAPFAGLAWAKVVSKRWSVLNRATLYIVMLAVTLGSLAVYAHDAWRPRQAQAAFVYVAVPPVSWLLIAIVLAAAALISRRLSRNI